MKSKVKIGLLAAYCLGMAAFIVWLVFSTSWIARTANGTSVHKVDFASFSDKYLGDYIHYYFDTNNYDGGFFERLSIYGWAYCDTEEDNSGRHSTLILNSDKCTYELTPYSHIRTDVRDGVKRQLGIQDVNISIDVGFIRQFSLLNIKDGVYDLYICCWENETNHGMSYTFFQIIKHGSDVEIVPWSTDAMETHVSATSEEVASGFLDVVSVADGLVHMRGWEFIPEMESKEQSVYVELTDSSGNSTQYPARMMSRTDVAKGFNDQRYAQSGYMTVFPADGFEDDTYSVRVFVENGGEIWRSKHYTVIKAGDEITVMQQ